MFHPDPSIGFLAQAERFASRDAAGRVLAPAKTIDEMQRIVFNDYLDAALCALFMFVVVAMLFYGAIWAQRALANPEPTTREVGAEPQLAGVA